MFLRWPKWLTFHLHTTSQFRIPNSEICTANFGIRNSDFGIRNSKLWSSMEMKSEPFGPSNFLPLFERRPDIDWNIVSKSHTGQNNNNLFAIHSHGRTCTYVHTEKRMWNFVNMAQLQYGSAYLHSFSLAGTLISLFNINTMLFRTSCLHALPRAHLQVRTYASAHRIWSTGQYFNTLLHICMLN